MAGALHVTNGDSTAQTLKQTSLGGTVLAWRDVLHEGPLTVGPRSSFLEARASFLASSGWGSASSIAADFEARDDELLRALRSGRPVVLWFEHDLYDQLQLLDLLALIDSEGAPHESLELIQVGSFPGRPGFRGLGELSSAELETLWPQRVRPGRGVVMEAAAAWADVCAPDPRALARRALATGAVEGLPFLAPALARLLEELPDVRDGLSRTERQLLQVLAEGPRSLEQAFIASQMLEDAPFHGDTWVFRALWDLGRGDVRLVETRSGGPLLEPRGAVNGRTRQAVDLVLTDDGRRVRAGGADRVSLLGIDRWVGGTRVCSGAVWRWDRAARALLAPA